DRSAEEARQAIAARGTDYVKAHSLIEAHYFAHDCFLTPDQLIRDADHLSGVPMRIVQSRYDMVCPPAAALRLAQACPHAGIEIVPVNGHAMTEAVWPAVGRALEVLGGGGE